MAHIDENYVNENQWKWKDSPDSSIHSSGRIIFLIQYPFQASGFYIEKKKDLFNANFIFSKIRFNEDTDFNNRDLIKI